MFSSVGATTVSNPRHSQSFGKNYAAQLPKGFSVRVFKGPTISSFPHTATAKFDIGYHNINAAEPRSSQTYYPSRPQSATKPYSLASEQPKSSRSQATNGSSRGHDSNTNPSYSIYRSASKDAYIYERSLSSKSDIYSNSEFDASSTTFSPASIFSPAMSTDSLTTIKSPTTPQIPLSERDMRTTPKPSSRNSFAMHIPALSQAQSAIKGIFRNQNSNDDAPPRSDTSFPHALSGRTSALDFSSDSHSGAEAPVLQGRSATPIRLSPRSGSGSENRSTSVGSTSYSSFGNSSYKSNVGEGSEYSELDQIAKANAEYNAALSTQYPSQRTSVVDATLARFDGPPQLYPDLPLRSSPEQVGFTYSTGPSYTAESIPDMTSSYATSTEIRSEHHRSHSVPPHASDRFQFDDTSSDTSEHFIPPLAHREWRDPIMSEQPAALHRPKPEAAPPTIPQIFNSGPQNRYVPASRTMMSRPVTTTAVLSEPPTILSDQDHREDRPLPIPPPLSQSRTQRERRASVSQTPSGVTPQGPSTLPAIRGTEIFTSDNPTRVDRDRDPTRGTEQHYISGLYAPRDNTIHREPAGGPIRGLGPLVDHRGSGPPKAPQNQEGERERDHVRRSPLGQRPNPSAIYSTRDPASGGTTSIRRVQEPTTTSRDFPHRPQRVPSDEATESLRRNAPQAAQRLNSIYYPGEPQLRPLSPMIPNEPTISPRDLTPRSHKGSPGSSVDHPSWRESSAEVTRNEIPNELHISRPDLSSMNPRRSPPSSSHVIGEWGVRNTSPARDVTPHIREQVVEDRERPRTARSLRSVVEPASTIPLPRADGQTSRSGLVSGSPVAGQDEYSPAQVGASNVGSNPHSGLSANGKRERKPSFVSEPQRPKNAIYTQNTSNGNLNHTIERTKIPPPPPSAERSVVTSNINPRSLPSLPDSHRPLSEPLRRNSDGDRSINSDTFPRNTTVHVHAGSITQLDSNRSVQVTPAPAEPQRRYSDGDQVPSHENGRNQMVLSRNVRWNENLVCPSPIFPSQRRKGWFNRKGDQLWTNEGAYKPLPPDQQYPPDLDNYPEQGEGWMNEEGVRIDMQHRLIPKQPLRSALKENRAHNILQIPSSH